MGSYELLASPQILTAVTMKSNRAEGQVLQNRKRVGWERRHLVCLKIRGRFDLISLFQWQKAR